MPGKRFTGTGPGSFFAAPPKEGFTMQKTKKSIAKRFKLTASGKLMRRSPNSGHLLRYKSTKSKRRNGHDKRVDEGFEKTLKSAMPFA